MMSNKLMLMEKFINRHSYGSVVVVVVNDLWFMVWPIQDITVFYKP